MCQFCETDPCTCESILARCNHLQKDHDAWKLQAERVEAERDQAMETARTTERHYYERRSNDLLREQEAHAATKARLANVEAERDFAQANAMEMHRALSWPCTCRGARSCRRCLAMDGKAGGTLAACVPLWRELEREIRIAFAPGGIGGFDHVRKALHALAALDEKGGGQ